MLFTEEIEYQQENRVLIDFYYGKMSFKVIKEELTYDPYTVVGMLKNPTSNLHSSLAPLSLLPRSSLASN